MAELLENSDNTNERAVVSESPANEATISLAAVQALADALQKIEAYIPTVWVDNESPDIDAAHLNKAEQAIMRVTTAMNSAVDVIKDLQSQVNTTNNNLSNISYSWPVQFVGNGESLKTVVNKYCKTNTSQKYILNRIADSPFIYNGETIVSGILTLDYSVSYWNNHPMYTFIDGSNTIYIGTLNISNWTVDAIVPSAKKSDLTDRTAITLTPQNSYEFSSNYTYGYKRLGVVELHFQITSAFDKNTTKILTIPDNCKPEKQVWFPVYSSDGGTAVARGMINGTEVVIVCVGASAIDGVKNLYGHVIYFTKS